MLNKLINFRNIGLLFTGGASALTYKAWIDSWKQEQANNAVHEVKTVIFELKQKIESGTLTPEQLLEARSHLSYLENNVKDFENKLSIHSKIINKLPSDSPVTDELKNNVSEFKKIHNSMDDNLKKALEIINNNKKNLLDNLGELINNYKEFLSNLNLDQLCQLISITSSSLILICLLNIIIIYFANYIIDYLNLEIKFPKLAKFLKIRKMFQNFNIFLNLLLIFIALFLIIYVNYYTLFR